MEAESATIATLSKLMDKRMQIDDQSMILDTISLMFEVLSEPEGYKLLRKHPKLGATFDGKIREWHSEILHVRNMYPQLAGKCDKTRKSLDAVVSKCGAVMRRRYNFREVIKVPERYDDHF